MRRLIAIVCLGVALPLVIFLGTGANGDDSGGYEVRAIFDNVAAAVPGEDVKIAGAKVGTIASMDVTANKKAAVVLKIDDAGFTPFRRNAKCAVRPQSLIGEKFVECQPGTDRAPPLAEIERGDGKGQHLLPVSQTSSPVDLDLVNNTLRRPYAERFAILLGEFGTGLAGRGKELNEVIFRANPALRETDKVLKVLARQNRVLARLAVDSDESLAPLAREKKRVAGFIVEANKTGQATAERSADIERTFRDLPPFLTRLRPTLNDLGGFAGQATPVFRDLNAAAPQLSRVIEELGPFSKAATPAVTSLGKATVTGRPALISTQPLFQDLESLAADAKPVSINLLKLTNSLTETKAINRIMEYLFYQGIVINGFDSVGHYLRAALVADLCIVYAIAPAAGCNANFTNTVASGAKQQPDVGPALAGAPKAAKGDSKGSVPPRGPVLDGLLGGQTAQGKQNIQRIRAGAKGPSPALAGEGDPVLDYLLGSTPK